MDSFINARSLYKQLAVKCRFNDWINIQIKKFALANGEDYYTSKGNSTGGRPQEEYYLSSLSVIAIIHGVDSIKGFKLLKLLVRVDNVEASVKEMLKIDGV